MKKIILTLSVVLVTACGKQPASAEAQSVAPPQDNTCPAEVVPPIVSSSWCGEIVMTVSNHAFKVDLNAGTNVAMADANYTVPGSCGPHGCSAPCQFKIVNGFPSHIGGTQW